MSRRIRIGIVIALLLVAGGVAWMIYSNKDNLMDVMVDSSGGGHYSLQLPPDMVPAYFNDNASFQYQSEDGSRAFIIIDDSKEKIASYGLDYDLDTYMKIASRALDSAGMYVNTSTEINGIKALQATIQGSRQGVPTTFILTTLETSRYYYQLICWSPTEQFEANEPVLENMLGTFHEENPQPLKP